MLNLHADQMILMTMTNKKMYRVKLFIGGPAEDQNFLGTYISQSISNHIFGNMLL